MIKKFDIKDIVELEREIEPDPDKRVLAEFDSAKVLEQRCQILFHMIDEGFDRDLVCTVLDFFNDEVGVLSDGGFELGVMLGFVKQTRETARRMLGKGNDRDEICDVVDLSRDEVEKFRSQRSG